ncbi:MAG: response regulator [Pseudanabaenaceae cyanobacterium]
MKLRVKILLATAALLMGLIASLSSLAFWLVRHRAEQEEVQAMAVGLEGILQNLEERQETFSNFWNDWSQWDDAYRFVQDGNSEFIRSNLVAEEFTELPANFMAFVRVDGHLTFATGYDEVQSRRRDLPAALLARWQRGAELFTTRSTARDRRWGFLRSEVGTLLVALHPILPSNGQGAANGTAIFAQIVRPVWWQKLTFHRDFTVAAYDIQQKNLPPEAQLAGDLLRGTAPTIPEHYRIRSIALSHNLAQRGVTLIAAPERIAAYTLLSDIDRQPLMLLRVESPRYLWQQAELTLRLWLTVTAMVGTVFIAGTLIAIDWLVLSRLSRLQHQVQDLVQGQRQRLSADGTDEIAQLACTIDTMREALSYRQESQQQAEAALRLSELKFATAFQVSPNAMALVREDGYLAEVNTSFREWTGYDRSEFLGASPLALSFLPRAARVRLVRAFRQSPSLSNVELEVCCPNGEFKTVFFAAEPIQIENVNYLLCVASDISDRKQAELETQLLLSLSEAIGQSPDFNGALAQALQQIGHTTGWSYGEVWTPTADLGGLECNTAHYIHRMGLTVESLSAIESFRYFSEGMTLSYDEGLLGWVWQHRQPYWLADLHLATGETLLLRRDLAIAAGFSSCFCVPVFAPNPIDSVPSVPLAIFCFFLRGVHPQEERRLELVCQVAAQLGTALKQKQTEAELRALFATMDDTILTFDAQGYCLKVAPTATAADWATVWTGKSLREIFGWQYEQQFIGYIWQALNAHQPLKVEYALNQDDRPVWYTASISPLADDTVLWIARDITDLKQTADALRTAKNAAEVANRTKSEFLANMSHELRTPLNAILGFAQLLGSDTEPRPDWQESLNIINRSGEHLLELIDDVLEMAKIEAGKVSLNENGCDLYAMLDTLKDMLRLRAESKNLKLEFYRARNVPQFVKLDGVKLRQVIINLLSNAIKFTQEGSVSLRVRCLAEAPPYCRLLFEVEDTGVGIAQTELGQIFDAFVQSESGRQSGEGTGLGLPIGRRFAQMMGGDLTAQSIPGRGSVFRLHVYVQTVGPSPPTPSLPRSPLPQAADFRILLVEDNLVNQKVAVRLLNRLGCQAAIANNGLEAIAAVQANSFDLVLMDVQMPEMDGLMATQRIRQWEAQQGKSPVPIVAMTANAMAEDRERCLAAGMNDHIGKPVRLEDLRATLAKFAPVGV